MFIFPFPLGIMLSYSTSKPSTCEVLLISLPKLSSCSISIPPYRIMNTYYYRAYLYEKGGQMFVLHIFVGVLVNVDKAFLHFYLENKAH